MSDSYVQQKSLALCWRPAWPSSAFVRFSTASFAQHPAEKAGLCDHRRRGGWRGRAKPLRPRSTGAPSLLTAGLSRVKRCSPSATPATPSRRAAPTAPARTLHGTLGKKPGTHPGFAYSQAMIDYGNKVGVWGFEEISEFITAPQKYVAGTKMTFVGLKKPEDRINVIAYLHSEGSTLPFPAPNPAAAAASPPALLLLLPARRARTATGSTATPPATSGGLAGAADAGAPAWARLRPRPRPRRPTSGRQGH